MNTDVAAGAAAVSIGQRRERLNGDARRMRELRERYVRRLRGWLEVSDLRLRDKRLTEMAQRMRILGLYSSGTHQRDCRFGIVGCLFRLDGRPGTWHTYTAKRGWAFIFYSRLNEAAWRDMRIHRGKLYA